MPRQPYYIAQLCGGEKYWPPEIGGEIFGDLNLIKSKDTKLVRKYCRLNIAKSIEHLKLKTVECLNQWRSQGRAWAGTCWSNSEWNRLCPQKSDLYTIIEQQSNTLLKQSNIVRRWFGC